MRRPMTIGALCAAAVLAAGCGSSKQSPEKQISSTITSYYSAAASGDGGKICDLLASATRAQLEQRAGGKKCSDAVSAALAQPAYRKIAPTLKSAKVTHVTVNGSRATATVVTKIRQLTVPLQQENGAWKIQAPLGG